jgi:putative FmdB family regulatory protein
MPVYEYRCKSCGETHEIEHGYNDDRPTKCPTCGGQLIRVFHPIGVVFKGSGFHKNDYGKSGVRATASDTSGASAGEGKSGEGKPSDGKSGESKGESKSGEGKSAGEKSGESKSGDSKSSDSKQTPSKPSDSKSSSDSKPAKAP